MCLCFVCLCSAAGPAFADMTRPSQRVIECYCTDTSGARVELGETICLHVDGRTFMAQCQMSTNVPFWREVAQGCLGAALPQNLQPAVDTGAIDAQI